MAETVTTVAKELLEFLAAPLGTATVSKRKQNGRTQLVVRLAPSLRLPPEKRPLRFKGMDVVYETRKPAQPFIGYA